MSVYCCERGCRAAITAAGFLAITVRNARADDSGVRRPPSQCLTASRLKPNVSEKRAWVIQQLREAFPYDSAPGYLIFDRGAQFGSDVIETMKSFGIQPKRTSFRSPRQNGVAERWVGNCRRDLLDHVIVVNERHLKRLMNEYVRYYHEDRTHLALAKGTPTGREGADGTKADSGIVATPRLGGLRHRYDLAA